MLASHRLKLKFNKKTLFYAVSGDKRENKIGWLSPHPWALDSLSGSQENYYTNFYITRTDIKLTSLCTNHRPNNPAYLSSAIIPRLNYTRINLSTVHFFQL